MGGDLRDAGDMVLLLSAVVAVVRFLRFAAVAADASAFAGAAGGGGIAGAAFFVAAAVWRRRLAVKSGARRRRLIAAFGLASAGPASMTVFASASASVPEVCVLLLSLVLLCSLWVRDRVLQLLLLLLTSCGTKADAVAFCGNISVLQNIKNKFRFSSWKL